MYRRWQPLFSPDRRRILPALTLLLAWTGPSLVGPAAAQAPAASVTIASPKSEETIHDNTGRVPVTVIVKNSGALAQGGALRVLLDGLPRGPDRRMTSFALEGVERGEHTLRVELVDPSGKSIASSDSVTFYLWQASALFPGRK